jgi:hypothetical protein
MLSKEKSYSCEELTILLSNTTYLINNLIEKISLPNGMSFTFARSFQLL